MAKAAEHGGQTAERTALLALAAGMPCLVVTCAAAFTANALAIWVDLLLTVFDVIALSAAWHATRCNLADRQRRAVVFTAICMAASLAAVTVLAASRLITGGVTLSGTGIGLALAQNAAYAIVNSWILIRWRRRIRTTPDALSASQYRLFADKLTSNLLLTASLAATFVVVDAGLVVAIDAAAGMLLAGFSAWWSAPVLAGAWRHLTCAHRGCTGTPGALRG